jgi:hypothetical protein
MLVVSLRRFLRKFRKIDFGNAVCCAGPACDCWEPIGKSSTITRITDRPCPFRDRRGSDQGWTGLAQSIEPFLNGRNKGRAAALGDGRLELTIHSIEGLGTRLGTRLWNPRRLVGMHWTDGQRRPYCCCW